MAAKLAVGTQWGDEGKAKFIDYLSERIDIIVRYQGGANAGHTVEAKGQTYVFHLIPSGILYPNTISVVGNGVVLDPQAFAKELNYLREKGVEGAEKRILISEATHIVLPLHRLIDNLEEELAGQSKIGTTRRGIGICYGDKVNRTGLRMIDLLEERSLRERLSHILAVKNPILTKIYGLSAVELEPLLQELLEFGDLVRPMVVNTSLYLNRALAEGRAVLLEGAQGTALDIDFGTYPYVTSSNPTTGGAIAGSGISFGYLKEVIGICKAYVSRVGEGPFPTELHGKAGELLRHRGNEFGATTGRPRRCGWFDVELLRHAARVNGLTSLALTKIDVLSHYDEIQIGVAYSRNGELLDGFPATGYDDLQVKYEIMPGWRKDIRAARSMADLPKECRAYIDRLVELVGVPIQFISVGPGREDTIVA